MTVTVPAALLVALRDAWAEYRQAPTDKSLGVVFGIEELSNKQKKQITKDKDRSLSRQVLVEYFCTDSNGQQIPLSKAIENVADRNGVGSSQVEKAHKKYSPETNKLLKSKGIIEV